MIKDFSNPHKWMKPSRVEDYPQWTDNKTYRIVRVQGLYTVQAFKEPSWIVIVDYRTQKDNIFQTLQEAENLIARLKQPSQFYYYDI